MSGTPHMSGRRDAPEPGTDDHLDPSDLLDEDGKLDVSMIHSLANESADRPGRVTVDEAEEIRERMLNGESQASVAEDLGRSKDAVRQHALGEVSYVRGEAPEHPPLEFVDDEWRLAEIWVTRHGRVYHTDPDCADIQRPPRRRNRQEAERWGMRECRHCAEGIGGGDPDKSMVMMLRNADPEDLGLSPGGDRGGVADD